MTEELPKSRYVRQTERALYEYAVLKVALENEQELEREGLGNLFPNMIASYEETIRGSVISKPTENIALKRAEKQIKVTQIDRALSVLSPDESELVDEKYLNTEQPSDVRVMGKLTLSQANYYRIKDRALRKVATALNII